MTEERSTAIACRVAENGALVPTDFESAYRLSKLIAASGLAPTGLQTPEKVFVAIQMGLELGLQPMQALQNIAVINGRPSVWGDAALALCQRTGALRDIQETFEGEQGTDGYTAVCTIVRDGRETPVVRRFSIADAKRANLWGKAGPWVAHYPRMLQMRARGFAIRDSFPDALKGLYVAEELISEAIEVETVPAALSAVVVASESDL